MITVQLEDHGQDCLTLDLEYDDGVRHPYAPVEASYIVVGCRPFQSWFWKGTRIHNTDIQIGDVLDITTETSGRLALNYPVERVVRRRKTKVVAEP